MPSLTRATITFFGANNSTQRGDVTEWQVEHSEFQHDLVSCATRGMPADFLASNLDRPAVFEWRSVEGFSERVCGFAKVMSPNANRLTPGDQASVRIFGTTYAMRKGTGRTWTEAWYPRIARDITELYQFGIEFDEEKLWKRTVMQGQRSDWQLLSDLANELGYCLTNENGVLRFIDPFKEFARLPEYNGTIVLRLPPGASTNVSEYSVDMTSMKSSPTSNWELQIAGPNADSSTTFHTRWEAPSVHFPLQGEDIGRREPSKFRSGSFPTWASARQFAQAEERRNVWSHYMQVTAVADPRYKVGRLVYVIDSKNQYTGHWFVTDVTHRTKLLSTTDVESLSRLRLKRSVHGPERVYIGGARPAPARPATILSNGKWRLERQWQVAS